jgi:hypothetical protein
MLPLKWKIFRVLNYLQLIFSIGVIGLIAYATLMRRTTPEDYIFLLLFITCFSLMLGAAVLNIYITNRNMPDKPLFGFSNSLHYIFLVTGVIINLGLLALLIFAAVDTFGTDDDVVGAWIALLVFFFLWLINFLVIVLQFQVKPFIRKNYQSNLTSLIDSIGKE